MRSTKEEDFERRFYEYFWIQIGSINQPLAMTSFLEKINDGQYVTEYNTLMNNEQSETETKSSTRQLDSNRFEFDPKDSGFGKSSVNP